MSRRRWHNSYQRRQGRSRQSNNTPFVIIAGVIGLILLYVSLMPMILNTKNQGVLATWWNCIWAWGEFLDYLRILLVVVAIFFILRGVVGVIISPFKTTTATQYILFGGIAGLILLIALWSGVLNGSVKVQWGYFLSGSSGAGLNQLLIADTTTPPPGLDFPFIRQIIIDWGWLKLALAGFGVWVIGTAPFSLWWKGID